MLTKKLLPNTLVMFTLTIKMRDSSLKFLTKEMVFPKSNIKFITSKSKKFIIFVKEWIKIRFKCNISRLNSKKFFLPGKILRPNTVLNSVSDA